MTKKYYVVQAKCGHVGRGKYVIKDFPVRAYSREEAANIVRQRPRVKHDYKDAILYVEEITDEEYNIVLNDYINDPFISCKCIQDQRFSCGDMLNQIFYESRNYKKQPEYDKYERKERVEYKRRKMREKYSFYEIIYIEG